MNSNKYKSSTSKFFDETEDITIESNNDSDTIEVEEKIKIADTEIIDKEALEKLQNTQSGFETTAVESSEELEEVDEELEDEYEEYEEEYDEDEEYEDDDEYEYVYEDEDDEGGIRGILKSKKAKYIAIASAATLVLLSVVIIIFMISKVEYIEKVDIYVDGTYATTFTKVEEGTIDQVLLDKGYDEENYKRDESIKSTKDKVYLVQKKDITITYFENDWEAKEFEVYRYTLSEVLVELGLEFDESAVVYVDNDKKDSAKYDDVIIRRNSHIKIVVNSEEELVVEEAIKYSIIQIEDDTLPIGTREVVTPGQDGIKKITYNVFYSNGKEVSREIIAEEVVKEPVDEEVRVGTKDPEEPEPTDPPEGG